MCDFKNYKFSFSFGPQNVHFRIALSLSISLSCNCVEMTERVFSGVFYPPSPPDSKREAVPLSLRVFSNPPSPPAEVVVLQMLLCHVWCVSKRRCEGCIRFSTQQLIGALRY